MDARRASLASLIALALAGVAAGPAQAAKDRPIYVFGAKHLTAKRTAPGRFAVRLHQPAPSVTSFYPKGSPVVGLTTRELVARWDRLFARRAPLATIDEFGDRRHAVLVRLNRPRLTHHGKTLALAARVVDGDGGRLAERLADREQTLPSEADATTVSIDPPAAGADPPPRPSGPGLWVRVHTVITTQRLSGDGERWCDQYYGQVDGRCRGAFQRGEPLPGASSDHGTFQWTRQPSGPLDLKLWAGSGDGSQMTGLLAGTVASERDNTWVVKGWLGSAGNPVFSGDDPYWTDAPGGPLDLNVIYNTTNEYYEIDVYGYVWAQRPV
jgi:hypothetical protein